jgi:hypothetical protein
MFITSSQHQQQRISAAMPTAWQLSELGRETQLPDTGWKLTCNDVTKMMRHHPGTQSIINLAQVAPELTGKHSAVAGNPGHLLSKERSGECHRCMKMSGMAGESEQAHRQASHSRHSSSGSAQTPSPPLHRVFTTPTNPQPTTHHDPQHQMQVSEVWHMPMRHLQHIHCHDTIITPSAARVCWTQNPSR